jgi:hypothetical protein
VKAVGIFVALALGLLASGPPTLAVARPSVPPAPLITNVFVSAPTLTVPTVTIDAFARARTRPLGYASYGTAHPRDNAALPALGREIAPDLWWIQWRMLPLTTADVANGSSDGAALTAGGPTAQFPGPIERHYVIAVSAVSGCSSIDCLAIPGEFSNQITRKGLFGRGVRVSRQRTDTSVRSSTFRGRIDLARRTASRALGVGWICP